MTLSHGVGGRASGGEALIHLIYTSAAAPGFSKGEIIAMAEQAGDHNREQGVTGMLLFSNQSFFEVLEGPKAVVDGLFEKISQDCRHGHLTKVFEGAVPGRSFGDWSWGLAFYDGDQLEEVPGNNDFFTTGGCLEALPSSRTKELLTAFRDGSWRAAPGDHPNGLIPSGEDPGDIGTSLMRDIRTEIDRSDLSL